MVQHATSEFHNTDARKTVCLPIGPRCEDCDLSNGLCPSARKVTKTSRRKTATTVSADGKPKIEIKLEETATEEAVPASKKSEH